MKLLILFLCVSLLVSCVSQGPKDEVKNKLGYLNGKTYGVTQENDPRQNNTSGVVARMVPGAGIPVGYWGKVKNRNTIISGSVFFRRDGMVFPISNQKVFLKDFEGRILQEDRTSPSGEFKFNIEIPNGSYKIKLFAKEYKGSMKIEVKDYELKGLRIQAFEKLGEKLVPH